MSAYVGVNGAERLIHGIEIGKSGSVRHVYQGYCGVNGVARPFLDVLDDIDYAEIELTNCYAYDYGAIESSSPVSLATCQQYGSIDIDSSSESSIRVTCTTRGKAIAVAGWLHVVFQDGHKEKLEEVINAGPCLSLSFPVSYYLYCYKSGGSGYGQYTLWVYGKSIYEGDFTDSTSGTTTVTSITDGQWGVYVGAENQNADTFVTEQSYHSITIGERNYPVCIVNHLS